MKSVQIIILAAGHGKRMNNNQIPKVLLKFRGKPLIEHLLNSIKQSQVDPKPVIVIGQKADMVKSTLGPEYEYIYQPEQSGTGHAVATCQPFLEKRAKNILVLYGDMPLITAKTIRQLVNRHINTKAVLTMVTVKISDFLSWRKTFWDYGRVVRNNQGHLIKIVEKKDASEKELNIQELNPSYFIFQAKWLWKNISLIKNNNMQKEFYLTDLVEMVIKQNRKITSISIPAKETLGVNTPEQFKLINSIE